MFLSTTLRSRLFALALAASAAGIAADRSDAALAALAVDPTPTKVYFQFSTLAPYDAYQATVVKLDGTKVGLVSENPLLFITGAANFIPGLTLGVNYKLIIKVRYAPGSPFITEAIRPFTAM